METKSLNHQPRAERQATTHLKVTRMKPAAHQQIKIPELKPEWLTAIVDSREQVERDLSPLNTVRGTLTTGDFSIVGMRDIVTCGRKSEADLLGVIGRDRERFSREIVRLESYEYRCLVLETSWEKIRQGNWRSKVTPAAAEASLISWSCKGIPILMADSPEQSGKMIAKFLFLAARARYRENRALVAGVLEVFDDE